MPGEPYPQSVAALQHGASYSIRWKPSASKRKAVILIGALAI
jgi:hypothetical protein